MSDSDHAEINWQRLARDLGILVTLVLVTFALFAQAARHEPAFHRGDIHVL